MPRLIADWPRWPLLSRLLSGLAAALASAVVLGVCAAGAPSVPSLGAALVPGAGAWASAADAAVPRSQSLDLPGMSRPGTVWFDRSGFASIRAASLPDAYLALGYLHARFRLSQLDLERRIAEGRLAQLEGSDAVPSDRLELRLGLLRTAEREWAATPKASIAGRILAAYARGVNDGIAQLRAAGQWPAEFALAGVYPAPWTPVDSLAVQGEISQQLTFSTGPLSNVLLERSLGAATMSAWFGLLPAGHQQPFDPGPYGPQAAKRPAAPAAKRPAGTPTKRAATPTKPAATPTKPAGTAPRGGTAPSAMPAPRAGLASAAAAILGQLRGLRRGQLPGISDSSAVAVNGPKVAGGLAMLAANPHLAQTIPAAWYEVAISAPGLDAAGVTVPGLPGILIGHNQRIAWTMTNTQNQSAFYYVEQVRRRHAGHYFWAGRWRRMRQLTYTIPVRDAPSQQLTVYLTVHGPVLTRKYRTISVDWAGGVASPDVAVLQQISSAANFAQFSAALAGWRAPAQTFVYADNRGNIGAISAGTAPVVTAGSPWLPMPGSGSFDPAGAIPFRAVPMVYNPASHVIVASGQRPVTASYPYYLGTASGFDPGYRSQRQYALLRAAARLGPAGLAADQADVVDQLAALVLPAVLRDLRSARLTQPEQQAARLLASWNDAMSPRSAAASIWWTLWSDYLTAVFGPWWRAGHVPVRLDPAALGISASQSSLDQVLASWTAADPANPAFTPPGSQGKTAAGAVRAAFAAAVRQLHGRLGGGPASWAWGRLHAPGISSLTLAPGFGAARSPSAGSPLTVDASGAPGGPAAGASLRLIVAWLRQGRADAEAIYPGGQAGNPLSPWYHNLLKRWRKGQYLALPPNSRPAGRPVTWRLRP